MVAGDQTEGIMTVLQPRVVARAVGALALLVIAAGDLRASHDGGGQATAEEAQAMVAEAIGYFDAMGVDATLAKVNGDPGP